MYYQFLILYYRGDLIKVECTSKRFEFQGLGRRKVECNFDGGSDHLGGGGLLLREVEALWVELFLQLHPKAPERIVLDLDATDDHFARSSRRSVFLRLLYGVLPGIIYYAQSCVRPMGTWPKGCSEGGTNRAGKSAKGGPRWRSWCGRTVVLAGRS